MRSKNHSDNYGVFSEWIRELERWSYEEAKRADAEWLESHQNTLARPLTQWSIWNHQIPELQKIYLSDDTRHSLALFRAISLCGTFCLPLPSWCVKAMNDAYDSVSEGKVRGWSEAFGEPNKGRHLAKLRKAEERSVQFLDEVLSKIENGASVEKTIRDAGRRYLFSFEEGREKYYEFKKKFPVTEEFTDHGRFKRPTGKAEPRAKNNDTGHPGN